jgi:peptide/nickel transport system ATP-binding protein
MTALNPIRTIGRQMVEAIQIRRPEMDKKQAAERALQLLNQVHIREPESRLKAYPHQLSGGMLQRVLIAMAISAEAELIVADEPTSALDVTVQAGILDLLLELQETTGVAIMMITHDLGVARLMSDRIHVMRGGKFVESGPAEQIVDAPRERYTKALLAAIPDLGPWDDPALDNPELAAAAAAAAVQAPSQPEERVQ